MRTSEEIYHRVRWDARFDPARFVLGVARRGAAPQRVPLPEFSPGGDVPWHRVLFVEADGEVVWDRATGVDRLGASEAGRVREPRVLRAPYFAARTPHAWDPAEAAWRPVDRTAVPTSAVGATRLRVLTWNTLWDRYNSEYVDTARRRPALLAALEASDADVIALQEVEPELLTMLLGSPWVHARYTLGTDPDGGDVDDTGLVLLSRLPVREAGVHSLRPHKAVAAVTVATSAGLLVVGTTHLTSDHSPVATERRKAEQADIADWLSGLSGDVVLMGDFNDPRVGGEGPAPALGLADAWTEAHGPSDRTPTFDPGANRLAALISDDPAGRPDRVLLRGDGVSVAGARLHGETPIAPGLHVSDHYGVAADLRTGGVPASPGSVGEPTGRRRAAVGEQVAGRQPGASRAARSPRPGGSP